MTKIEVQALKLMTRSPIETVQINTPCRFYEYVLPFLLRDCLFVLH
jgi:hypothetical protein